MSDSSGKRDRVILASVAALVFFLSLILVREGGPYISPDETANAFFANLFADTFSLRWFEPLNLVFDDALHPRSIISMDGWLMPGGFIGLPAVYGLIMAALGGWLLPLITPAIAALAVFAWYGIMRRMFDRKIALWSGILLATHPAWWYYTARNLMPNVPLIAFLIFGAWFIITRPLKRGVDKIPKDTHRVWVAKLDYVLAGACLGVGVAIRPIALVWIMVGVVVLGWFYRKQINWRAVCLVVLTLALTLAPLAFLNRATYGSALSAGYFVEEGVAAVSQAAQAATPPTVDQSLLQEWQDRVNTFIAPVLPFGIHPKAMARHFFDYGLSLFWWLTVLGLAGLPLMVPGTRLDKEAKKQNKAYLATAAAIGVWLLLLYGSWTFTDNPDPQAVTIANSYVRYWLPIYVFATPAIAYGIQLFAKRALTERVRRFVVVGLLIGCVVLNGGMVYLSPEDGLLEAQATLRADANVQETVLQQTEDNSVIIVDRGDKIFFPHRRVLYPLRSDRTYDLMPRLERRVPLYYYGITFPEKDVQYLNTKKLKERGLQIERLQSFEETSLYKIISDTRL